MEKNEYVRYEVIDRVAWITIDRPDKRNALNFTMVSELLEAFKTAELDAEVKVCVLRANGKAFCAGADLDYLKRLQAYDFDQNLQDSSHLKSLFEWIYKMGKPVIAMIQGHAIAGGAGLATVCDFAFSVPEAQFGYTEVRIGFIPAIVMVFLIRKIGETRAKELLLSGDIVDAATAEKYNMINKVVPAAEIEAHVTAFAARLCSQNSGQSMAITKKMIGDVQHFPISEALTFAARMNARARGSEDCKRGIAAFLNKENITW
ncbi:MAG: enoyl-CoA hydratase/isomerase family protein [Bacteroidetes bacterium]|nr:enoyl-CoA hydratase/isomerase family protein [Bacteroidota bacterium]